MLIKNWLCYGTERTGLYSNITFHGDAGIFFPIYRAYDLYLPIRHSALGVDLDL